jgi:hypothetical protein
VLTGSLGWVAAVLAGRTRMVWAVDAATILAAVPSVALVLPLLPVVVMSDGMKSLALLAGVEALLLGVVLPAVGGPVVRTPDPEGLP